MEEFCRVHACRINHETGEPTQRPSQLHKDLLGIKEFAKEFTREKANNALYLADAPHFLGAHKEGLIMDSNNPDAEPLLASFYEEHPTHLEGVTYDEIAQTLAKKFNFGVKSYEDALKQVITFNKEKHGAHSFLATLEVRDDGKYETKVVLNSESNQDKLVKTIQDRLFAEEIERKLNAQGVALENSEDATSRYSTKKPHRTVDGYYGLIQLHQGVQNLGALYNETGHFLVDALGKYHPIIKKMLNTIRQYPQLAEDLLGQEAAEALAMSENIDLETLGHIVGKFLQQEQQATKWGHFKTLIKRGIQWIGSRLALTDRAYKIARFNTETQARNMVKAFLGDEMMGSLTQALRSNTILYDMQNVPLNKFISKLRTDIQQLIKFQHELRSRDYDTRDLNKTIQEVSRLFRDTKKEAVKNKQLNVFTHTGNLQKKGIKALTKIINLYANEVDSSTQELYQMLEGINGGRDIPLNYMSTVVFRATQLTKAIEQFLRDFDSHYRNVFQAEAMQDILAAYEELSGFRTKLGSVNKTFESLLKDAQERVALKLLSETCGSQFVAIEQHVRSSGLFKLSKIKATTIDLQTELNRSSTLRGSTWYSRWIQAMADSPDIINQIVAQTIEEQKYIANNKALEFKDKMFDLYARMSKKGLKLTKLFEVNADGNYSGNLISERHWGQWEADYDRMKREFRDAFYSRNSEGRGLNFRNMSDMYNSIEYITALKEWRQLWHNEHSSRIAVPDTQGNLQYDEEGHVITAWAPALPGDKDENKKAAPAKVYYKGQLNLTGEQLDLYNEYMQMKKEIDSLLGPGKTNLFGVRAPQFKGNVMQQFRGSGTRFARNIGYSLAIIADNPNDTEYGGEDNTYGYGDLIDEDGNDIYTTNFINTLNSIDRIPMYGVNKINPKELSVDLVYSTIAYAHMAYNYNCLSNVVDATMTTADYMYHNRHVNASGQQQNLGTDTTIEEAMQWKKGMTADYDRLQDYLHMQVFNNFNYNQTGAKKRLKKVLKLMGRLTTVARLGWNANSALVNATTGLHEMMKEAGNENYGLWNFVKACTFYTGYWFNNVFQNMWHQADRTKPIESVNKLQLLRKKFDWECEVDNKMREYRTTWGQRSVQGGFWDKYTKASMAGFGITESWMSNVGVMAKMMHTKLRNKHTGKMSSLWDLYKCKDGRLVVRDGYKESDWEIFNYQTDMITKLKKHDTTVAGRPREIMQAIYRGNEDYNDQLQYGKDTFILDGETVQLSEEEQKYYAEYAASEDNDRKLYISYKLISDQNEVERCYWVINPDTNKLIRVEFASDGIAEVKYKGATYNLDLFFSDIQEKHSDTIHAYTKDNMLDDFDKQYYTDSQGASTTEPLYLLKDSYVAWDSKAQTRWRMDARAMNNRLHGVYNKMDKGAYGRTVYGAMMAILKRYSIGLIDRKITRGRLDLRTGRYLQGTWFSMYDVIKDLYGTDKQSSFKLDRKNYKNPIVALAKLGVGTARTAAVLACSFPLINSILNSWPVISSVGIKNYFSGQYDPAAVSTGGWHQNFLKSRGFAHNQITNINRFINDQTKWYVLHQIISFLCSYMAGRAAGDDDDGLDGELARIISKYMTKAFIWEMKAENWLLGNLTENDEEWFTEENLFDIAAQNDAIPFDIRDIAIEILHKTLIEQEAYSFNPFTWVSLYNEVESLISNEMAGITPFVDLCLFLGSLFGRNTKTEKDLDEMIEKDESIKAYRLYEGEEGTESARYRQIIQSGIWEGWFKSSKQATAIFGMFKYNMPFFLGRKTMDVNDYYRKQVQSQNRWGY